MPFTLSHAAAALPFLRTPLARSPYVPAALVIGAMSPDLPYFLPGPSGRSITHTLLGVVTIDLLIGVIVLAAWVLVVRAAAVDLAPAWLRERVARPERLASPAAGLAVIVALIVGTLTHVLWDFFTHPGVLEDTVPFFSTQYGPLTVTKWLQHGSSVFGLVVIASWLARWVRRTPRLERAALWSTAARVTAWVAVAGAFVCVALLVWAQGVAEESPLLDPYLVFRIARRSIGAALLVAAVIIAAWQVGALAGSRRERPRASA